MSIDLVNAWFNSGKPAWIEGRLYRPLEHPSGKGAPLVAQRGQADTVFLSEDGKTDQVLKIFRPGRRPDSDYLGAIAGLLPSHEGFRAGTGRSVLGRDAIRRKRGCHYNKDLRTTLEGALLMPRVNGVAWGNLADQVRDGRRQIDIETRLLLCRHLSEVVSRLESNLCAHRDVSCGNLIIHTDRWGVSLIDFDGLHHPSLPMPAATTAGSEGYLPSFVYKNGEARPEFSWCRGADRFAMAVLNVEFLVMEPGAPDGGDGGLFSQQELGEGRGDTIRFVQDRLKRFHASLTTLFRRAIGVTGFKDCPSPADWIRSINLHRQIRTAAIAKLEPVDHAFFREILGKRRRYAPLPPPRPVPLPPDPWRRVSPAPLAAMRTKLVRY